MNISVSGCLVYSYASGFGHICLSAPLFPSYLRSSILTETHSYVTSKDGMEMGGLEKKKRNWKTPAVMVSSGQWGGEESGELDELMTLRPSVRIQSTAFPQEVRKAAPVHQSWSIQFNINKKKREQRGAFTFLQPPTPGESSDSQCAATLAFHLQD